LCKANLREMIQELRDNRLPKVLFNDCEVADDKKLSENEMLFTIICGNLGCFTF